MKVRVILQRAFSARDSGFRFCAVSSPARELCITERWGRSYMRSRALFCVIPSVAEGPRIFLGARHFDSTEGKRSRSARGTFHLRLADRPSRLSPLSRDELFSLTPADLLCYAYAMVNRQDASYSPRSPESGRHLLPAEINLTEQSYPWWCAVQ